MEINRWYRNTDGTQYIFNVEDGEGPGFKNSDTLSFENFYIGHTWTVVDETDEVLKNKIINHFSNYYKDAKTIRGLLTESVLWDKTSDKTSDKITFSETMNEVHIDGIHCFKNGEIAKIVEMKEPEKVSGEIQYKDLKDGYTYHVESGDDIVYIAKRGSNKYLRIDDGDKFLSTSFSFTDNCKYTEATEFEEKWLELCIHHNKFFDLDELFEEACRKYPVGTKFSVTHIPASVRTVKSHNKHSDWCVFNNGGKNFHINLEVEDQWLYYRYDGTDATSVYTLKDGWAKIVEETPKNRILKGEYIVVTIGVHQDFKENFCFKQRETDTYLLSELDCKGSISNGLQYHCFDEAKYRDSWRYATKEEAEYYEKVGKPYDVTQMKKEEEEDTNCFPVGAYVVLLSTCDGDPDLWGKSIPINHVYKLRQKSSSLNFLIEKDMADSTTNGWKNGVKGYSSKLKLRLATKSEKHAYEANGGPVSIFTISEKPKSKCQAVYCETFEEWEFCCKYYGKSRSVINAYDVAGFNTFTYKKNSMKPFSGWHTLKHFKDKNYEILYFEEWSEIIGKDGKVEKIQSKIPEKPSDDLKVGDRVVLVGEYYELYNSQHQGDIGTITRLCDCMDYPFEIKWDNGHCNVYPREGVKKVDGYDIHVRHNIGFEVKVAEALRKSFDYPLTPDECFPVKNIEEQQLIQKYFPKVEEIK